MAIASVPSTTTSFTDDGLLPATTYSYVVAARDAAGNVSQPSPIATMTTDADTTAPTAPGRPSATAVTYNSVSLTWAAATDNVGVLRYDIVRNGAIVGQATGTSYTDTTVNAGATYAYTIVAWDAAGNSTSSEPTTVFTPPGQSVFYDNFESGGLTGWSTVSGVTVQSSVVHAGSYACRETSSGTGTYAYANLPGSYPELWAQAWVNVVSRSTSASLFGFRTASGASLVNVYIDASGRLSLRNNIGSVTSYSTSTIAAGSWHRITLHAVVNGSSSSLDVGLDGVAVSGLSLTGQNLGTAPITKLQLGDTASGRSYDIALDDVQVSPATLE
jgi:chitodextrinase